MSQIKKSRLANGIFWLEIPNADLRILCGCPADAVKHMMKRGVISTNEDSPVFHETGPNAILLSDLAVQKGAFANLAEFPVLQMLYRQGMILPNHPGNTGTKPLLLGHPDQLDAQIKYIHRGNYGLLSEQEMMKVGIGEKEAKELMRLKLRFAFGKIADSQDLLDSLVVENEMIEIRNGAYIKRIDINVFEFSYAGETVQVDLNLQHNEYYLPPYKLGKYQVGRDYFSVIHSGEGDGWDIERPSMGSIICFQGKVYLIDVGPNIETTLYSLGIDISEVEGIFMTHCHDDHFSGLPSLIRSDHRIKLYATNLVRAATIKKISALTSLDESRFDLFFENIELNEGVWNNVEGLEVKPVNSPHPMETTILYFRTQWDDGYKSYAHLADIASFDVLKDMVTEDENAPGISQQYFEEVQEAYLQYSDIKKIDNGGGLIHGVAKDFIKDKSDKIIFAHTARPLNEAERLIGSGAPFGTEDILIPGNHDVLYGKAHHFLSSYFPGLPKDQFRLLLNHKIVTLNPEEIILREGDDIQHTYLLLSGSVELLDRKTETTYRMSAGSFVGDMNGLYDVRATETYRAISFVRALKLPIHVYKEFVKRNNMLSTITSLGEKRELLQKSHLFGEAISDSIKNAICAGMHVIQDTNIIEQYDATYNYIALVYAGTVDLKIGDKTIYTLSQGDSMFEDHAVYGMKNIFTPHYSENAAIAMIPIASIKEIPIVQWKMLENITRQMRGLIDSENWEELILEWKEAYRVGIDMIDTHHEKLLELTNSIVSDLQNDNCNKDSLKATVKELVSYTHFHFDKEEELFTNAEFSKSASHKRKHYLLRNQIDGLGLKDLANLNTIEKKQIIRFLKRWILIHILLEDRKFASFINSRGPK